MHLYSPAPGARARGRVARPCAPATATRTRGKPTGGGGDWGGEGGRGRRPSFTLFRRCRWRNCRACPRNALNLESICQRYLSADCKCDHGPRKPAEYRDLHAILPRGEARVGRKVRRERGSTGCQNAARTGRKLAETGD